jgi:hypothetical protein
MPMPAIFERFTSSKIRACPIIIGFKATKNPRSGTGDFWSEESPGKDRDF